MPIHSLANSFIFQQDKRNVKTDDTDKGFVYLPHTGIPARAPRTPAANPQTNRNHADGIRSPFVSSQPERMLFAPSRKGRLLKTQIKQPLTGRAIGSEYLITSDKAELPRGSYFTVLYIPVGFRDLALFTIGDLPVIGRWMPDVDGFDWILVPGWRIKISGQVPVRVVGRIIPCPLLDVCASGRIKAQPGSRN
jgi:hypothetical protein